MTMRTALFAAGLAILAAPAVAQDYPNHPISMIVPFAAGGPTDTVARLIAQSMSQTLGQQVVIENVGGAGGTLGAGRVAKADPDGYTILLHHIGQATAATLYRKLPYKTLEDFQTVGLVTDVPMTIVTRKDFPAKDLKELIAYVKANPDKVTLGNAGVGSASHLCGMLIQEAIKTQLVTAAYKGTGPAMNDLVGGQIDLMCDQTTNTTGQIKGGAIKAYAVTTKERLPSLSDLPTTAEAGLPSLQIGIWHGIYAPKGTPEPIIQKLSAALQTALEDQNVVKRFNELGTVPEPKERATPAAHEQHLKSEVARWKGVIEAAGVFAD
jgi:tripartite-type tricarboxylate transporter receptor subunit TctC